MPNKLSQFWQELKRRNVIRVFTVYAGAVFVIIELINNITEPLRLPGWTPTFVIVLLAIGFPIVIIFSWIYDIHPGGGMVKTGPVEEVKAEEIPKASNGWKIASYISFMVIVGMILLNIIPRFGNKDSLVKSIAVLPFNNFSTDPDQEKMCLGLTNEIINHLYKIKSFEKVTSFTSVMSYRDSFGILKELAEELNVNYILQGSYTKIGNELRVTAELIEPSSDTYIWQEEYNKSYEKIISIQSDIALQIANQINAFITKEEKERIKYVPTVNQKAYELLQQAIIEYQNILSNNTEEVGRRMKKLLSLALDAAKEDPAYADAHAWAGIFTLYQGVYIGLKEITLAALGAMPHLEKALELDPECSMAHLGIGNIHEWVEWDFQKAEESYKQVNLIMPNKPINYYLLSEFYLKMNRLEDIQTILDNRSSLLALHIKKQVLLGNQPEAKRIADSLAVATKMHREWNYLPYIAEGYIWIEEYDSAWSCIIRCLDEDSMSISIPRFKVIQALAHYERSEPNQANKIIDQLKGNSMYSSAGSPAYYTGWYYSWIKEIDSAFHWLEKAYENRSPEFPILRVDPAFNSLKEDSRYWDLYERTGHKAYDDYMASKKE
jgi:TolB-like protein